MAQPAPKAPLGSFVKYASCGVRLVAAKRPRHSSHTLTSVRVRDYRRTLKLAFFFSCRCARRRAGGCLGDHQARRYRKDDPPSRDCVRAGQASIKPARNACAIQCGLRLDHANGRAELLRGAVPAPRRRVARILPHQRVAEGAALGGRLLACSAPAALEPLLRLPAHNGENFPILGKVRCRRCDLLAMWLGCSDERWHAPAALSVACSGHASCGSLWPRVSA